MLRLSYFKAFTQHPLHMLYFSSLNRCLLKPFALIVFMPNLKNMVSGQRKCKLTNDINFINETDGRFPGLFWYLWISKWTSLAVLMENEFSWYSLGKFKNLLFHVAIFCFGCLQKLFFFPSLPQIPYLRRVLIAISSVHSLWQVRSLLRYIL